MSPSVSEILAPLDPHRDRIFLTPMSSEQVDRLEQQVGLPAPVPLRDYLMEVGVVQDLTHRASSVEVYHSVSEFTSAREFLTGLLSAKHAALFPFGGDGGGNEYCLPPEEDGSCRIHQVDHESRKVVKRHEFGQWLQSVVAKALKSIASRPPNARKVWSVQFSLSGVSIEDLMALLNTSGSANVIDPEWMNGRTSPAGVTCAERRFEFDGAEFRALRQEHPSWAAPVLYFDLRESLAGSAGKSRIRELDSLFKGQCPGYRLIDYGVLDGEKIASGG